jgi:hypothetical protein
MAACVPAFFHRPACVCAQLGAEEWLFVFRTPRLMRVLFKVRGGRQRLWSVCVCVCVCVRVCALRVRICACTV